MKEFGTVRSRGTRLQVGMRVKLEGAVYLVALVNDCRARLDPVSKTRHVEIAKRFGEEGEKVSFEAKCSSINVSPNSELEIV